MEKEFNEKESLQVIQSMIAEAKSNIKEDGFLFLLWGWLVIAGNLLAYLWMKLEKFENIGISWSAIGTAGMLITMGYVIKKKKKERVKTHVEEFMKYLWIGFIIALIIFEIFLVSLEYFTIINPVILIITGIATFATGGALRFKWLIFGGITFWIFGIITFMITSEWQFLISALAMVLGYLVPGYILRHQYLREKKEKQQA